MTVYKWKSGSITPRPAQMAAISEATAGAVTANDFMPTVAHGRSSRSRGFADAQSPFVAEARLLGLDPDAIAAKAIEDAVSAEKARRWLEENKEAIEAQNAWIEKNGLPLAKYRMF